MNEVEELIAELNALDARAMSEPVGVTETPTDATLRIAARDVRPGPELDAVVYACLERAGRAQQRPRRYSRSLTAALAVAYYVTDFVLERSGFPALLWGCRLEWDTGAMRDWRQRVGAPDEDPADERVYVGCGEDARPTMAICKAILAMYRVEIVPDA